MYNTGLTIRQKDLINNLREGFKIILMYCPYKERDIAYLYRKGTKENKNVHMNTVKSLIKKGFIAYKRDYVYIEHQASLERKK